MIRTNTDSVFEGPRFSARTTSATATLVPRPTTPTNVLRCNPVGRERHVGESLALILVVENRDLHAVARGLDHVSDARHNRASTFHGSANDVTTLGFPSPTASGDVAQQHPRGAITSAVATIAEVASQRFEPDCTVSDSHKDGTTESLNCGSTIRRSRRVSGRSRQIRELRSGPPADVELTEPTTNEPSSYRRSFQ